MNFQAIIFTMNKQVTKSARSVSLAVITSRLLGLVREIVFAYIFGANKITDAFFVAFRIPNLFRDLLGEGALTAAFVPTFTDTMINQSEKKAINLMNLVITSVIFIVGSFVILCIIFTPGIVSVIGSGFKLPEKISSTITMTRIMFPFLLLISLGSIFMGFQNAKGKFFLPATGTAVFNIVIIIIGIFLIKLGFDINTTIIIWAFGVLLGGCAFLIHQIIPSYRLNYKFRTIFDLTFKNKELRKILKLMGPAVIGVAGAQINIIINTKLGSHLAESSISYYTYAFRLIYFPIGAVGVAISVANLAHISKNVARNQIDKLKSTVGNSLKLNLFLLLPAAIGMFLLPEEIVSVIWQRGNFLPINTIHTASALKLFTLGLVFYGSVKILAPTYYALNNIKIPIIGTISGVIVNLIVSLSTYKTIGYKGLVLGTISAVFINFLILFIVFIIKLGWFKNKNYSFDILKIILSATALYFILFYLKQYFNINPGTAFFKRLAVLLSIISISGTFYFLFSHILGLKEPRAIFKINK